MNDVINLRLNKDNLREAQALEVGVEAVEPGGEAGEVGGEGGFRPEGEEDAGEGGKERNEASD